MAGKGSVQVVIVGEDKSGEVFAAVKKHLDETQAKAKETSASLGSIGKVLQQGLAAAGIAIGLREIIGGFKEMVTSSMEMGVQLGHLSQQTGISVQNLSVLRYASQQTGIGFETLTKGFRKLSTGVYEWEHGSKKAADAFAALNISQRDMKATGGDMYQVMEMVADRFQRMPDGINKSAIATELFGRSGTELIPALNQGAGGIEKFRAEAQALGLVLDKDAIEKMEKLHQQTVQLEGALQGLGMKLTATLGPALELIGNKLVKLTEQFAELTNLNPTHEETTTQAAMQPYYAMPDNIRASRDPKGIAQQAASTKKALEDELKNSVLSRAKKSELQKQWDQADLRENQAYLAAMIRQREDAQGTLQHAEEEIRKNTSLANTTGQYEQYVPLVNQAAAQRDQAKRDIDQAFKGIENAAARISSHPSAAPRPSGGGLDFVAPKTKDTGLLEARERDARAIRELAAEGAKAEEEKAKAHAETLLAILESQHKLGLISESAYLAQKQTIQDQGFKAEQTALEAEKTALSAQMRQLSSEKPKTEKDRLDNSAKQNDLQKQMIELDGKLVDLGEQRRRKEVEIGEARAEAVRKQRAQVQQMEAELEQRTGGGSVKTVVAQRQKSAEERQNLANGGATPQQLAEFDALQKLEEEKIKIAALDRDGERIKREAALAEAKVEQQALGHSISNREGDQQLTAIRAAELAQLQQLSAAYAQYGEAGRDAETNVQREITQTMQAMEKESDTRLKQIGEGYAHALFDPLFDMSTAWNKKGKAITDGLMRMTSQVAEHQLFSALFGDSEEGGKGASHGRKGLSGTNGLVGDAMDSLGGVFHRKKASPVSNGTGAAGAGALKSAEASLMQLGKGASGGGGIQVILYNNGSALQVESTQQSGGGDGGESQVVQIVLKQLDTNGPVAQRLASMFSA